MSAGPTRYQAAWVVPVTAPPIRDGHVDVEDGVIVAVGERDDRRHRADATVVVLPSTVLLPGLVNAHTHLELSHLRGAVAAAVSQPVWASAVMSQRGHHDDATAGPALTAAVKELRRAGTALVGDIANTRQSVGALEASQVEAVVFREVLGFNVGAEEARAIARELKAERDARVGAGVRLAVAAHAPYSVAPTLFKALTEIGDDGPRSVHVAESSEELELLEHGTGAWRTVLEERGRWIPGWNPPGCGPVEYLDALGWAGPGTLAVHGVHLTPAELDRLAASGATLVTCPRSNAWTGAGTPPIAQFYASGVPVAVGTDSLASAPDLNLFAELAVMRRIAPGVPAGSILRSATVVGAEALAAADRFGSLRAGRQAALIGVDLPGPVDDVEEYLLSGIQPEQIVWLEDIGRD